MVSAICASSSAASGRVDVLGGEQDLDARGQKLGPHPGQRCLVDGPAYRGDRGIHLPLSQPQQRQPRLGFMSPLTRLTVGRLGSRELAAKAMQLAQPVERSTDCGPPRLEETVARRQAGPPRRATTMQRMISAGGPGTGR